MVAIGAAPTTLCDPVLLSHSHSRLILAVVFQLGQARDKRRREEFVLGNSSPHLEPLTSLKCSLSHALHLISALGFERESDKLLPSLIQPIKFHSWHLCILAGLEVGSNLTYF